MNRINLQIGLAIVLHIAGTRIAAAAETEPEVPPVERILAWLRPDHPRVMARPETFPSIHALVAKGGLPAKLYTEVKESADQVLAAPVSKYEKPDGRRLLSVSRRVVDRVPDAQDRGRGVLRRPLRAHRE